MIYQGRAQYPVREVILHTAAFTPALLRDFPTPQSQFHEIRRWHMSPGWQGSPKGWSDIGYHYLAGIDLASGKVNLIRGRAETTIGAHVKEANRGSIGICMVNVLPHHGITQFEDYFTEAHRRAVKGLIEQIAERTKLIKVTGHNSYANKECPGFKVKSSEWMPQAGPMDWLRAFLSRFRPVGA